MPLHNRHGLDSDPSPISFLSSSSGIIYLIDALLAARTLYGFIKTYSRATSLHGSHSSNGSNNNNKNINNKSIENMNSGDVTEYVQKQGIQQMQGGIQLENQDEGTVFPIENGYHHHAATQVPSKVTGTLNIMSRGDAMVEQQQQETRQIDMNPYHQHDHESEPPKKKIIRVYMDGCFDMMHFGHANAFRQAKALGNVLVVGVCSDDEIRKHKGPPVMNDDERCKLVEANKWVDEVVRGVPYTFNEEYLSMLLNQLHIDYIVHGDDPCLDTQGADIYGDVKKAGIFKTIKRTEGVSSTDIVGRMLLTKNNSFEPQSVKDYMRINQPTVSHTPASTFLPTTRRIIQFVGESKQPRLDQKVVYIDGAWDMFHSGHVDILLAARELGDFLLVGIHDDATVNQARGRNFPILNLHERTLSVLSCKYVDEVIIGAPKIVTEDMIKTMNIEVVAHGSTFDGGSETDDGAYDVPKRMGIYRHIEIPNQVSIYDIIDRIVKNRRLYSERNVKKSAQEKQYFEQKQYIREG